jgi:ribosome-associated toxin RatA of RatAB toxin-antitoxin module
MSSHREQRHLPFTPPQLFDLVADVDRYPEFLPWIVAAHVRRREGDVVWVNMVVGTNGLHRSFATKAVLVRPKRIEIRSRARSAQAPDRQSGSRWRCYHQSSLHYGFEWRQSAATARRDRGEACRVWRLLRGGLQSRRY